MRCSWYVQFLYINDCLTHRLRRPYSLSIAVAPVECVCVPVCSGHRGNPPFLKSHLRMYVCVGRLQVLYTRLPRVPAWMCAPVSLLRFILSLPRFFLSRSHDSLRVRGGRQVLCLCDYSCLAVCMSVWRHAWRSVRLGRLEGLSSFRRRRGGKQAGGKRRRRQDGGANVGVVILTGVGQS